MIINENKYNSFLSILSIIGIVIYNYNFFSIEKDTKNTNCFFSTVSYDYSAYSYNENIKQLDNKSKIVNENEEVSNLSNIVTLAKENAPYSFKDLKVETFDDEFGKSINLNVYLNLPDIIDDDFLIQKSDEITALISKNNQDNITVIYL